MKEISLNQMSEIEGGVTSRECYFAGIGLLCYIGWSNIYLKTIADMSWETAKECFSGE